MPEGKQGHRFNVPPPLRGQDLLGPVKSLGNTINMQRDGGGGFSYHQGRERSRGHKRERYWIQQSRAQLFSVPGIPWQSQGGGALKRGMLLGTPHTRPAVRVFYRCVLRQISETVVDGVISASRAAWGHEAASLPSLNPPPPPIPLPSACTWDSSVTGTLWPDVGSQQPS